MSEGLAQGPYVVAGVGFEPATLRTEGTKFTTEPPCPTVLWHHHGDVIIIVNILTTIITIMSMSFVSTLFII